MTGRYRERQSAAVEVNVQNNYGTDMLISIVEIIQKHVKDPAVLSAIGDEILALQQNSAPVPAPVGKPLGFETSNPKLISGTVDYGV
jgi:hypothetical protein